MVDTYRLRPSLANVWLHCPKAPMMRTLVPEIETIYTSKGIDLHNKASGLLQDALNIPRLQLNLDVITEEEFFDIKAYIDFVKAMIQDTFPNREPYYLIEQKLDLSEIVLSGNGVVDFAAYDNETVLIVDYKTGFNRVGALNNPQLNLYGLGVARQLINRGIDIKKVRVAIAQPSQSNFPSNTMTYESLHKWWDYIKPMINEAHVAGGVYRVGEHCNNCSARALCAAYIKDKLLGNDQEGDDYDEAG